MMMMIDHCSFCERPLPPSGDGPDVVHEIDCPALAGLWTTQLVDMADRLRHLARYCPEDWREQAAEVTDRLRRVSG